MELSVVIPLHNEEENIEILFNELMAVLGQGPDFEIIAVDDGSTDKTLTKCKELHQKDKHFKVVVLRKNYGQSLAMAAGFHVAKGKTIVTMDGDLQNDPKDIPALLDVLNSGYDLVAGWRYERKDPFMKKFMSLTGRLMRWVILSDGIHDAGCTLRVYKREVIRELDLRGEMHRYIAEMALINGFKITEMKVNHRPRKYGKTKYNMLRLPKGFLDLLLILYQTRYAKRPVHLFGGLGLMMIFIGMVIGGWLTYIKWAYGAAIANRPLLLLAVFLVSTGIQFLILGIISDVMAKIDNRQTVIDYKIREIVGD